MPRPVNLSDLRARSRLLANQRTAAFLTDSEVNGLVNDAIAELYDLLVSARGHEYYAQNIQLATSSGYQYVALPSDFYEALTLFANWGAQQLEELDSLDHLGDQVEFRNYATWAQYSPKAWRLTQGNRIELFPTPTAATNLELRYVPTFRALTDGGQTFDGVNGWDKMICARVAMEILGLQALPASVPAGIYERERTRIQELAGERAAANAPSVRDVRFRTNRDRFWRRLPYPVT